MVDKPQKSMEQVIREDSRYPLDAYQFLHEGLTRAVKNVHGERALKGQDEHEMTQRHVSGTEMCVGLRDEAIDRWGMLARTVLAEWGITETMDFGNMVYLLIRHGFMRKTEEDSIEDFRDVFDFTEAFDHVDHFELT